MHKKLIKLALLTTMVATPVSSWAQYQDLYYGQGYTIINRSPIVTTDLNQTINKSIKAKNVLDGIHQILEGTGWKLAGLQASDPNITRLFEASWPSNWNYYITDSLVNVLHQIGGEGWQLVIDPVNRLVSYEVKKGYR